MTDLNLVFNFSISNYNLLLRRYFFKRKQSLRTKIGAYVRFFFLLQISTSQKNEIKKNEKQNSLLSANDHFFYISGGTRIIKMNANFSKLS